MAGQEQVNPQSQRTKDDVDDAPEVDPAPGGAETTATEDIDALLDDIDETLESNAESFVRQFRQKGGQ